MDSKFILVLILAAAVLFAGCVGQAQETDKNKEEKVSPKPLPKEEKIVTAPVENATSETQQAASEVPQAQSPVPIAQSQPIPAQKLEEWCVPTKINYLSDPYVSVHSPRVIYFENTVATQTPVVTALESADAFRAPLTGSFSTLTKIGIPMQHSTTNLEFQSRIVHSDGTIIYSKPFTVKEVLDLNNKVVYTVTDSFTVSKQGMVSLESKLKYKIDGAEQVQCTAVNKIPFANNNNYLLPSISNIKVNRAAYAVAGGNQDINAHVNVSFIYSGMKPTSAELHIVSFSDTRAKIYFTNINLKCDEGNCLSTLAGRINEVGKEIICSANSAPYLQISLSDVQRNYLVDLDSGNFLKEFGGCSA